MRFWNPLESLFVSSEIPFVPQQQAVSQGNELAATLHLSTPSGRGHRGTGFLRGARHSGGEIRANGGLRDQSARRRGRERDLVPSDLA